MRSSQILFFAVALGGVLTAPSDCRAQTDSREWSVTDGVSPDSALVQTLRSLPGRPLSLGEALELSERNSPGLGSARAALEVAESALLEQKGFYDPEVFAEVRLEDTETPSASVFAGADVLEERATVSTLGARTRLGLGTSIEASLDSRRSETNDSFRSLEPEYTASGRLEVRQPLLAGFGPGTRAPLTAAEYDLVAETLRLDESVREVRAEAEILYWELFAAERDYAVQWLVSRQASSFLRQAEVRAEAGLIGPNQVATAEVFLAQQRLALLDREEDLDAASDRIAEIVATRPDRERRFRTTFDARELLELQNVNAPGRDSRPFADDLLRETLPANPPQSRTRLLDVIGSGLDEDAFVSRALESNSHLRAERAQLEANRAQERGARWGALPYLDLVGSVGGSGLSGTGQTIVFGGETFTSSVDGGLGDAMSEALALDHPRWNIGFEFRLPLGLREERGRRNRWAAQVWRQEQSILEERHRTESELRDALRRLRHGTERLGLARAAVAAAEEQVRIGLLEFANGRVTAFELVRLGADFASTQQELSRAVVGTTTARAQLKQLIGAGIEGE